MEACPGAGAGRQPGAGRTRQQGRHPEGHPGGSAMTNHKTGTRKATRTTETRKRKGTTGTRTRKHKTGTRKEWLAKRRELLKAEKEHTRRGDELVRRRQALLARSLETTPRFPRGTAGQREDVVDEVPPFRGGRDVSEGRHGTERREGREAAPDVDRLAAAGERPGCRQIAGDHRIPPGIVLPFPVSSVGPVAAPTPDGRVEIPSPREAGGIGWDARRDGDRGRRGTGEHEG